MPTHEREQDDTVVYVAVRVRTMDPALPVAEAFAVHRGRVVAVGSRDEVVAAAPRAAVVELDGTVLPGIIDAHLHLQRAGLKALDHLGPDDGVGRYIEAMRETFDDDGPEHPPFEDRVRALARVQPLMHELGITGVVDPAVTPDEMRGYREARRRGILTMRASLMPFLDLGSSEFPDLDSVIARLAGVGVATGFGDAMLRLGPIKVYADGEALKGQALLEEPWDESGYRGLQRVSDADYERLVRWCADNGWGVGTHAVGSAAIALVARTAAAAGGDARVLRSQVIHGYLEPSRETMRLAAEAGVVASLQPSIVWHNGAGLRRALGARAETAGPVRGWLEAGAVVAFGSDGPFFEFDPRHLVWQSVTRRIAGEERPLSASEAITVEEAFRAYTTGAAYAAFAEHERGMIRAGYRADWALWSADPFAVPIDELRTIRVRRTDVGGRTVHPPADPAEERS